MTSCPPPDDAPTAPARQVGLFDLAPGGPPSRRDPDSVSAVDTQTTAQTFWGNAKPPSASEMAWIRSFGRYPAFDAGRGKLSGRLSLEVADLKQATQIIVHHHYLHRGRTMAQLPYWVCVDGARVGVVLFALPRVSATMYGIRPMNLLELARLWVSPSVQGSSVEDSAGNKHAVAIASAAIGRALRRVRQDWYAKYPHLPDVHAVISWADTVHHEGVIYRAANFEHMGSGGGSLHGNRRRANGGRDQMNPDYQHVKSVFLKRFPGALTASQKRQVDLQIGRHRQAVLPIPMDDDGQNP